MNLVHVPLSQLAISPDNVRKTASGDIAALVASIQAHGLLQNLSVMLGGKPDTPYQVIAGGLRLRALQDLAARGVLPPDFAVPCNVLDSGEAEEMSLTENVTRTTMHPADEFQAFDKLARDGASIGDIAARFGKSERYVQQRMQLAHVAPPIMQQYRDGKATLDQLMALALTDDQDLQLRVWKAARADWMRNPQELRGLITKQEIGADSALGAFVGVEAYEKAGGAVRRDLFADDGDCYLIDVELVRTLALEKLEKTADKLRKEGWAWVETRIEFGWQERQKFGDAPSQWKGSKQTFTDDVKKHAGAVALIAHNGQTDIKRGLVRPEDRKQAAKGIMGNIEGGRKAPAAHPPGELAFVARQRLQAEAGQIVAGNLTIRPDTAIALLTAELADDVFYPGYDGPRTWVHVCREQTRRMPGNIRKEIEASPAGQAFAQIEQAWRERLPKKREDARAWILAQTPETVRQLLAFLVAREIDVVDQTAGDEHGIIDLAAAADVDLAAQWKPTEAWLATLSARTILELVKDAGADKLTLAALATQPKAKLPDAALPYFPAGWLPKPLRPAAKPAKKAKRAA